MRAFLVLLLSLSFTAAAEPLLCAMYFVGAASVSPKDSSHVMFGGKFVLVDPGQKLFAQGDGMILPNAAQGFPGFAIPLVLVDRDNQGDIVLTDEVHHKSVTDPQRATIIDGDQGVAVRCMNQAAAEGK